MVFQAQDPVMIAARIVAFLTAIPFHECAHAYVSDKLGDHTARNAGRLTLNPIKHIDVMGLLFMLLVGVGWAKPVPVDPNYYEDKKRGMALSALAGPLSNLLLAFFLLVFTKFFMYGFFLLYSTSAVLMTVYPYIVDFLYYLVLINVSLAIFNLIPIPPLDGSRILGLVLPEKIYFGFMKYERFVMIGLFALMFFGVFTNLLVTANGYVMTALNWATGWVDLIFQGHVRSV